MGTIEKFKEKKTKINFQIPPDFYIFQTVNLLPVYFRPNFSEQAFQHHIYLILLRVIPKMRDLGKEVCVFLLFMLLTLTI